MKTYDFEHVQPRYDIGAPKWLEIEKYFPDRPKEVIPFSVADMELPMAPEIVDGLVSFIKKYPIGYGKPTPSYLNAIVNWMKKRHNWNIQTDWIVPVKGIIHAFYECVKAFTNPGDGVILFTPVYYPMYDAISVNHRKLIECPLINKGNRYEIDFDLFEKLASDSKTKMLIFCSPHNPGGRVWSKEELEKLGNICVAHNILIASDEIHFDLVNPKYHHTVFATVSDAIKENCIIMTAPSKTFNLAGMETSNLVIPNEKIRNQFLTELTTNFKDARCNLLGMEACRIAYTQCENWLNQCISLIYHNADLVTTFLKEHYPKVQCMDLEGTYLLWMNFSSFGVDAHQMAKNLRIKGKLFFDDGFVFGQAGSNYERWNLACPEKYIKEGLHRLQGVLDTYKK